MSTATVTTWQACEAFMTAMREAGLTPPPHLQADGRIHRYRAEGDKPGCKNAWYLLHLDGRPAGAFGNWRTGLHRQWRASGHRDADPREAERFAQMLRDAQALARAERETEQAKAALKARALITQSRAPDPGHPYLVAKGVPPVGLRQGAAGELLVPLVDAASTIWNVQRILPSGAKRFLPGGRVAGLFALIGTPRREPDRLLICEGWATGATLHVESGDPVLCAMNCGNLRAVALAARARWPEADIVVCGDDDRHTDGNPGRTKATEAAAAIGARVCFPSFGPGEEGTDFNDMAANLRRRAAT